MVGQGRQLRDTVQEIKNLGLSLNQYLYVDGNVKKNKTVRKELTEFPVERCLDELERIRWELWWIYNDNQKFAERSGFGRFD